MRQVTYDKSTMACLDARELDSVRSTLPGLGTILLSLEGGRGKSVHGPFVGWTISVSSAVNGSLSSFLRRHPTQQAEYVGLSNEECACPQCFWRVPENPMFIAPASVLSSTLMY